MKICKLLVAQYDLKILGSFTFEFLGNQLVVYIVNRDGYEVRCAETKILYYFFLNKCITLLKLGYALDIYYVKFKI